MEAGSSRSAHIAALNCLTSLSSVDCRDQIAVAATAVHNMDTLLEDSVILAKRKPLRVARFAQYRVILVLRRVVVSPFVFES